MKSNRKSKTKTKLNQIDNQIQSLERKIKILKKRKVKTSNDCFSYSASKYSENLKRNATRCEERFLEIAKLKHLNLEFQYPIFIKRGDKIIKFYIADFCDVSHKIVFEIDGGYHDNLWQKEFDDSRTWSLKREGYTVYRIKNEDVLSGKTTAFLYTVYRKHGIDLMNI